jgi:hypothetical protein
MLGCYDFCAHYEWTFAWLERAGGHALVRDYWEDAIARDSQRHARALIESGGFEGMDAYWGRTLGEESPDRGFTITRREGVFRIDMHDCPSKGFLLSNGLQQYRDYCDHCMGWTGPMLRDAGFTIDHEHNHCGQCWWEMRPSADPGPPSKPGEVAGEQDVRLRPDWRRQDTPFDRYLRANDPDDKLPEPSPTLPSAIPRAVKPDS